MNQTTIIPASSMELADSSQEFSRANLFGMFVTLQLCQLTQPYGSLLFRGSSGFFWRVNPIASFVEASIIAYYLLQTVWHTWRDGDGFDMIRVGKRLRATASALLLLRGASGDEDGELMVKLMAASAMDGIQRAELRPENEGVTPSGVGGGQEAVGNRPGPSRVPAADESYEMGLVRWQSDNQDPLMATPHDRVRRRRTSQLESAPVRRTNSITGPDPSSERSRLLRSVFGPNALAHREMRIDIVTTVSVLTIFVKLLAIRSLWVFLTAGHFIICGWLSVQLLLLIFRSRELSDLDMGMSIRAARVLDAALKDSYSWWMLYVALHVPFLAYLSFFLFFRFDVPPWLLFFTEVGQIISVYIGTILIIACVPVVIIGVALSLLSLSIGIFGLIVSLNALLIARCRRVPLGFAWDAFLLSSSAIGRGLLWSLGSCILLWLVVAIYSCYDNDEFLKLWLGDSIMFTILQSRGLKTLVSVIWMIIFFFILLGTCCFVPLLSNERNESWNAASWVNLPLTLILFIYYLITYDSQGSIKPAWTEWLG